MSPHHLDSVTVKDLSMTQSKSMEQQKELCTLSTLKQRFDEQLKDNIKRSEHSPVTVATLASCVG
jgi:hypothetical protein